MSKDKFDDRGPSILLETKETHMPTEDADGIDGPQLTAPVAEGSVVVLADQLQCRPQKESFLWRVRDLHALTHIRDLVLRSCGCGHILWSLCLDNRLPFAAWSIPWWVRV